MVSVMRNRPGLQRVLIEETLGVETGRTYVGGFWDDSCSARSGGSSSSRNPCCGDVCVNRMLRAA